MIVDNGPPEGWNRLSVLDLEDIERLVYLNAADATTRYGTGFVGGVIQVFTKGRVP